MTESAQSAGTPTAAKSTFWQKASVWASMIVAFIFLGIGALKVLDNFTLPNCDQDRATDTVREIFKSKNVELTVLNDIKPVTSTRQEKTCTAHIESKDETANIDYKIFWEGWTVKVLIQTVRDEKPK
jgi:flagellar biosynthesis/type III secretory pathway M-ring protein FliF/YscJ